MGVDRACRVDPVAAGHPDIHQDHVGAVLLAERHCLVAGRRPADDDEASVAGEDRSDQLGQAIVVFGQQDA